MAAIHNAEDPQFSTEYHISNVENVLRATHIDDGGGYRALFGQPHQYTYGTHTYNKGAMVWHSLRGYLGDSVFYAAMRRLFANHAFGNISGEQLRDSLEFYTGVSLDDFFNFHVYTPGYHDFLLDSMAVSGNNATIYLRQRSVGTDELMNSCRVPVTFFGYDGERAKRIVEMDGVHGIGQFQLPFSPRYAIVDFDEEMARAATRGLMEITKRGVNKRLSAHFTGTVLSYGDNPTIVHVSHHWMAPDGDMPVGVVRTSQRYWTVSGYIPSDIRVAAAFQYSRDGYSNTDYPYLDRGFYDNSESLDSLRLMYRASSREPWQVVEASQNGSANEGTFNLNPLAIGEYALAIVDTALLGILTPNRETMPNTFSVYPNPGKGHVNIERSVERPMTLYIDDMMGRHVRTIELNSRRARVELPAGSYIISRRDMSSGTVEAKAVIVR